LNHINDITKKLFDKLDKSDKLKEKSFDVSYLEAVFGNKVDAKELRIKEITDLIESLHPCLLEEYKFNIQHPRPPQVMEQMEHYIRYIKQCTKWLENGGTNYKKIDIAYLKEVSRRFNCKRIKQ
jgi:hypothetical protein